MNNKQRLGGRILTVKEDCYPIDLGGKMKL
jgi:hypothetical protein